MELLLLLLPILWPSWLPGTQAKVDRCNETASEGPAEVEAMPSKSGTLLNVSVSDQGRSDSLFLSWDEPEGDALGYSLALYTLDPDLLLQNGSAGPNATSFQFQGLVPGTRYRAEVTAALTCAAVREVVTGQTSPSPVHNVSLSNRGSTSALHASWVDASGKKDGYRLVLYHLDSQVAVRNESVLADVSAFLFEGLLAGSEYALKITTLAGASQASTSLHQWTAPSAPEELRLQNLGSSTSLFASWTSAGGAAWLHLKLHSLLSSKVSKAISTKRGLTNYTFQHLDPGTEYHLVVSATAGTYMASGPNATAWTCPLSPTNVSLSSGGDNGSLQAQWSSPAGNRDFYLVTLQQDESKTPTRNVSVGGDSTRITFHSLSPGTQYTVQVTAMAGPYRASSQSAATWTQPVAPPGASLSSQGSPSTLHACWEEATGSGYKVELYTMEPHVLVLSSSVQRSITNLTYEGLSPGTQYTLVIRTIAGLHASPPLRIANWTYPLPPEELSLSNRGHSTSLYASWKGAPAVSIIHYRGVLFETKSQVQIRNVSLEKSWTNITFEGLSPGLQYTLEMTAVAGPYKSPMCTAMDWTYPLAPSGVTLTTKKHSFGLSAFWDKASGDRDQFLLQLYSREHPVQRNISVGPDTQNFTFLGLLPGTQYFLEVTALAGPYSASSQPATEWTYPLSLANVSVSQGQSPQELHVSWMESGGGRDHWVQLYADESLSIIRNVSVPRGVTHVDLDGLVPGARYRVEIISQAGPHRTSSQTAIGYTAPLMPLHPLVTNGGSTSALAVHWEAPAGQRDGYLVNVSEEGSSAAGRRVAAGKNSTSVTVVGLAPGSCYHVELWAVAGAYSSDLQNITGCTVPAAPMNVSLTNAGSSSVLHAAWAEPPGGRDYYRVILYSLASQTTERTQSLGPGAENITWTHLAAGSKFAVQVTAVKGPYESSSPNITQWTYPLAPANLTLASPSAFTLQASWTGAEQGGEGYTVELYETSSGSLASRVSLGWDARNHTFWSLSPGTCYSMRVSAAAGPYHAIAPNLTHWTRPLAPPAVHLVNEGHPDRLSASWGAVAGSQNSYTLILCHAGSGTMVTRTSLGKDAHNFTFEDLAPGHEYLLEVVSAAGPYWASAANVSNWTCPLAPLALRLVNEEHPDRLSASWEAAAGSRDSYMLTLYHAGSGTVVASVSLGKDAHNFTFVGLAPGHRYILEAVSKAGPCLMPARNISDWTYPLPPLNVYVTNQGHPDRLMASWGAAAGERDGYLLTLYYAGSGSVAANASVGRDANKFTFSRLAPGHKYLLEVVSMAGPYMASAGNNSDWTTPLVPADLSAVIGENRTLLSVSWGPSSSQQDYCQLWLREPGNSTLPQRHTLAQGQVQHVFWGLVPGRNYSVSLSCEAGPYWSSTGVLVVPVEPNPVKDMQCLPDSKAFYLNWTVPSGDVEAYELMVERPSSGALQPEIHMSIPGSEASLEGLVPNSSYRISLRVLGRNGMRSWAVTLLCNTSVEVLPPPVLADVLQFEAGSRVVISSDMFSEENGQIQYYGVIATTNESLLRPTQEIVTTTWYDHYYGQEDSYLAVLIPNPFHPSHRSTPKTWAVPVGTEECGHSRKTCNGKLKANVQYRFSIAAFTKYDQLDPAVSFTSFSAAGADATPFPIPIVAGVITGFLLTLTAIFGLVYWKRARAKRNKKSNLPQEMSTYSLRNVHRPVPIQSFKQYYEMKTANANNAFFQEFEELKEVGKEQPKVEAELPANVSKNRHPHVLPYDHSRVRLSHLDGEPHSDYINANFVPGYTSQQEFIVTQGPLKKTIEDFWRMVWEHNVCNIVMLTVGMENGRVLCEHYWPSESAPVSYRQIRVHLLTQSSSDEWTMREFKLWHEGLKVERHVTHLHYTAWPDHGIPESTTSIIAFRELVREHIQTAKDSGPTLVHCSAGVGRSGTFIALDRLLQQMKQEKVVDVFGTLYTMRMSRYQMIQTLVQYIFLHSCILDKISEEPLMGLSGTEISCPIPVKSFMQHYTQKSAKSKAGFLREYEILLEVAKDEASSATPSVGSQQTRPCSSILAYDRARIKFSPLEQGPFSDVFQAWLIPGCNSARDYLAIQGPDKVTMEDFWSLVWERGVHTIVTLLSCPEKNQVPSEACWPLEGDPVCTEMLTIQRGTEKHISGWRCIQLKLKHEKKVKERQVQRFLYPLWGRKQQPDARALVEFLAAVRRHTPHKKRAGPLLLHCSSGVGQMGTLIALDCLLHQLKVERSVDVYGVTLRLMRSCCLMTPTLDQYMFLYMCIRDILAQRLP
ncbi:receptor-type tyrosine-protein phosphatase beta [Alligator mississippiensis]|uniref:Receptor-type tyrosine-protein phosphatase V n=1 Tax=Alligator mississippiensis TaxID=8496 RepID=A0A151N8S3_ALLMI|nr:receptor-type tyrosine-protein phosphatase beta [Alligator mississippiensis]